jgi:2'-5' RNA ligase
MNLLRAFIAIEIPKEIKSRIDSQTAALRRAAGRSVRWVTINNIHLTLKFLGEISESNIEILKQALETEAGRARSFEIEVKGLGAFPNPRRPRVIWVGLEAPPHLAALQHNIDAATSRIGYPGDEKAFSPHLTIGRVREQCPPEESRALRDTLETTQLASLGRFAAGAIHLFRSDLKSDGPVYTCLSTAHLSNG